MPTIIDGTNGIDKIAAGAIEYADLPTGSVLQVVNATYGTSISTSSSTFSDTNLTATITPKYATSKILILAAHNGCRKDTGNTTLKTKLLRNGSQVLNMEGNGGRTGNTNTNEFGGISISYLDSPASTSALTYKTQFSSTNNLATVYINDFGDNQGDSQSTITLLEIAG